MKLEAPNTLICIKKMEMEKHDSGKQQRQNKSRKKKISPSSETFKIVRVWLRSLSLAFNISLHCYTITITRVDGDVIKLSQFKPQVLLHLETKANMQT